MRIIKQLNLPSVSAVSLLLITGCFCASPLLAAEVIGLVQGGLERQVYTNIPGNTVSALTNSPKFPDSPDLVTVASSFEAPSDFGDNYGQRLRGYLLPPVTGDYVFYIASDDQSILFLSTDNDPAHKRVIAYESAWRPPRMWLEPGPNGGTHISAPIRLEYGRSYYVEALHQEGGGGDNLAVTWQLPGSLPPPDGSDPIPGQFLAHGGVSPTNLSFQLAFFTCLSPCTGGTLFYRNYTVAGPQEPGPLLPALRVLPDASQRYFYANGWQTVLKIDSQLGTAVEMQLPASVPELSWPMGMAYDSTRNRELLASLGGEGFMYAYSPGQNLWSLVASMGDRDVDSIVYHAPQDAIYAFEVHRGTGPGSLLKFNASGIYQRDFQLPPIPVDVGVYPYQSEMVSVGDYLVLLIGPELNQTPPAPQHEFIYVIDPRSGESWLTYHHLGPPDPLVAPVITAQPGSQRRYAGQPVSFSVVATGTLPLTYAWQHNAMLLPNATNATLSIPNALDYDAGEYTVTVANSAGFVTSQPAILEVVPIPTNFPPSVTIPVCCGTGGYSSSNYKLPDFGNDPSELHVIGVYEGTVHVDGLVSVTVHPTPKPVVLALSAYQPVIWNISLDPQAQISAVYVSGAYNPQSVIGLPAGVPAYQVNFGTYAYGWEVDRNQGGGNYTALIQNIRSMTGLVEASFQGCYAGNAFEIPYLIPPNTPPTVTCGAPQTVTTYSTNGVFTSVNASVRDAEGDAITIVWFVDGIAKATNNLPQGPTADRSISFEDWFGIGTHEIAIFATDGRGQPQSCGLVLTVVYSPQQTLVVTSNGDSGPGTLRDIIAGAPTGATITFGITGTITLTSGELAINQPLNIQGPGAQVLAIQRADGTNAFRLFNIQGRGVSILDLTLRNGLISDQGDYDDGAGILNRGALFLTRCVLSGHDAMGEYSRGGALCNQWGAGLIVVGCTFAENHASGYYGEGGAIYNYGQLAVTNSTFSGNSVGGWGGAIHNDMMSQGTLIDSCTFTGNTAGAGGAIFNRGAPPQHVSPVFLRNAIIVGNNPDDVSHCSLILSGGYNLVGEVTDPYSSMALPIVPGPGDRFNVTPDQVRLGPLQLNGGPTPTHALLQHSIAIDAGPDSGCPTTDQRGVTRPFGPRCDIGAFESDVVFPDTAPEIVCPSPATWQATSSSGATGTLTVQVKDTDGDPLVVKWVIDGNPWQTNTLPDGAITPVSVSFTLTLPPGTHPIAVSVFDGTPPAAVCLTSVEVLPAPGSWVTRTIFGDWVSLSANPSPNTSVWAVEEQPPTNWMAINVTDGGVFDLVTHKVKYGPFFDAEPRTLGYKALPPPGFVGIGLVSGMASADGKNTPVTGDDRIVVAVLHPADLNPADWALRMDELTAYAAAWRTGGVWILPPNPIPMDYVTKAASLWLGGEVYTIDASRGEPPMWWVSPPMLKPMGLEDATSGTGIRRLSAGYVPGQALEVALEVVPSSGGRAFAVEESVPAGWRVESISHGGQFDSVNRQMKWGPFFDSVPRTLRYQLIPPADARGSVTFAGSASFDGASTRVDGPAQLNSGSSLKWSAQPSNGGWTLRLQGELGTCYEVESSTDLVHWTSVATLPNTLGSIEVPVAVVPQTPHLYFRAKAIP